jgi:hypothetical protein
MSVAYAQSPTALEQAELAGLSPEMRAQSVVKLPRGGMQADHFDPTTLQIRG